MCPLPPHPRVQVLFPNSFLLLLSSPLSYICHPLPESALCCFLVSHFTLCVPAPPPPSPRSVEVSTDSSAFRSLPLPPPGSGSQRRTLCAPVLWQLFLGGRAGGREEEGGGEQTAHNLIASPCSLTPQRKTTHSIWWSSEITCLRNLELQSCLIRERGFHWDMPSFPWGLYLLLQVPPAPAANCYLCMVPRRHSLLLFHRL